jgi:hypothetical protein
MPVNWNETTRIRLCFAVMEVGEVPGKWDLIAGKMGVDYTTESVR